MYCPHALLMACNAFTLGRRCLSFPRRCYLHCLSHIAMLSYHSHLVQIHLKSAEWHTHTHPFSGPFSGTTRVGQYQKGKTNLDFTEARDSEWPWHQLGHMQVCTSLQTDNHASTPPLSFLQAGCPSCRPTNSVKALKAVLSVSSC